MPKDAAVRKLTMPANDNARESFGLSTEKKRESNEAPRPSQVYGAPVVHEKLTEADPGKVDVQNDAKDYTGELDINRIREEALKKAAPQKRQEVPQGNGSVRPEDSASAPEQMEEQPAGAQAFAEADTGSVDVPNDANDYSGSLDLRPIRERLMQKDRVLQVGQEALEGSGDPYREEMPALPKSDSGRA